MIVGDYRPPDAPTLRQQEDALQKGLGRAVQWASQGQLGHEPLLAACLEDRRYDQQVEDGRGPWLWRLIQMLGAAERFRSPILQAFEELADERNAGQLCALALGYAQNGDQAFRRRLYEIVERPPFPDSPWLGEEELIALDGEAGFLFAARRRGRSLAARAWDWSDASFLEAASAVLGAAVVEGALLGADADLVRLRERRLEAQQQEAERKPVGSHRERMRAIPVQEILAAAETPTSPLHGMLRGWGMHAEPKDLAAALERLWAAREPRAIGNLLRIVSGRPLPEFDPRLLDLCGHPDGEVRRRAFAALKANKHPAVRAFALEAVRSGKCGEALPLFINNFEPGDEKLLLGAWEPPEDVPARHASLMDLGGILEKNPSADTSDLGVVVYALTPCENCRWHALRSMNRQQAIPAWMREEIRHDAAAHCRAFTAPTEAPPA